MLAQQVDAKLLSCFCEAKLSVQRENIGEDPPSAAMVDKAEEALGEFAGWRRKCPVDRTTIEIVDASMLMMKSSV